MSVRFRVFVSSVMEGFRPFRDAAAAGIEDAGAEPIMVERLPSLDQSSRNACLDGVQTSDAYLMIVGSRGGWETPSGRLAVEEEFEEAQRRALPILVFLQDVDRDEQADRLARRASDYVTGRFRTRFSGPADLQASASAAVRQLGESVRIPLAEPERVRVLLEADDRERRSYEASVRLALVPERRDELVSPERIASDDIVQDIYRIGHDRGVRFFDFRSAKRNELSHEGILAIEQEKNDRDDARATFRVSEQGEAVLQLELVTSDDGRRASLASMVIVEADLTAVLKKEFAFAAALFDLLDPHERFGRLWMGAAIVGAGNRYLVAQPPRGSAVSIRMGDDGPVFAEAARKISRAILRAPDAEIQRMLARFRSLLGPPRKS